MHKFKRTLCMISSGDHASFGRGSMRKREVYTSAFTRIQVELVVRPVQLASCSFEQSVKP